jgi:hypothetical protein
MHTYEYHRYGSIFGEKNNPGSRDVASKHSVADANSIFITKQFISGYETDDVMRLWFIIHLKNEIVFLISILKCLYNKN